MLTPGLVRTLGAHGGEIIKLDTGLERMPLISSKFFNVNFRDQLHRSIRLAQFPPRSIVSVTPSQTELLAALGLEAQVSGITKFCIHPPAWREQKTIVGGTKTLHLAKIAALQPDLIIANKEENERAQLEALAERFPVWVSDVCDLSSALEMIGSVGALTGKEAAAAELSEQIARNFGRLPRTGSEPRPKVAYLIWRKPFMAAGSDSFIHDMLARCGWDNVFGDQQRYPQITAEELAAANPDYLLLSSEPYPFSEKHLREFREICPRARVALVDGEMFSWYGSRMLNAPEYFLQCRKNLENSEICP